MQSHTLSRIYPWIIILTLVAILFSFVVMTQGANAGELSAEAMQMLEDRASQMNPNRIMWTIQEKYEYQQLEIASGMICTERIYGLPGENDMPEGVAISLAKRAVQLQHGISESIMSGYDGFCEFLVDNPAEPQWHVNLIAKDSLTIDYRVEINAFTSRILLVYAGEEGWG